MPPKERIYIGVSTSVNGDMSLEELNELRESAFSELRNFSIPEQFIDAVQSYRERSGVKWFTANDEPATYLAPGAPLRPVVDPPEKVSPAQVAEYLTKAEDFLIARMNSPKKEGDPLPSTAGEALSLCLLSHVLLERDEGAQARAKQVLPRSTIGAVAVDMLESCEVFDYAPGPKLVSLIRSLLDADRPKLAHTRDFEARYKAAWIMAQVEWSARAIARVVDVNVTTVSRWQKDPAFQKKVESHRSFIANARKRGEWPPGDNHQFFKPFSK